MTTPAERNQLRNTIERSRAEYDPFLKSVFSCFAQDFYARFGSEPLALVSKKIEYPENMRPNPGPPDMAYAYLLNVLHSEESVYPVSRSYDYDMSFARPGKITRRDWTPNVALQFAVYLVKRYDQTVQRFTGSLRPDIYIQAWGEPQFKLESLTLPRFFVYVGDGGWNRFRTQILIDAENKPVETVCQEIRKANALLEPNVRNHARYISG